MKRTVLLMVIGLAITVAAAVWGQAQSSATYTVQEVTGRVERDAGSGKWEAVKTGDTLKGDTIIRTVIGAKLTVKSGDTVYTVDPVKNGKLADIAASGTAIQIQGKISQSDTSTGGRGSGKVSTASARASDAAEEIAIEE